MKDKIFKYLETQSLLQLDMVTQKRDDKRKFDGKCSHRSIAKNEIVIEHDTDNRARALWCSRITIARLQLAGYNFSVFDHNGRSPHIHIYNIIGLEEQDLQIRKFYKKLFLKKYSPFPETDIGLNTSSSHLIAMEYRRHYKHNNIKKLVMSTDSVNNHLELSLLKMATTKADALKSLIRPKNEVCDAEWFVRWVSREKLPYGRWHSVIAKNIAIVIVNMKLNADKFLKLFNPCDRFHISGWIDWAEMEDRDFGFGEIYNLCVEYGIDLNEKKRRYSAQNDT